jgi:2-iminobutanoate/2-iminopropanoate deaminase
MSSSTKLITILCLSLFLTCGAEAQQRSKAKPSGDNPKTNSPRVEYLTSGSTRTLPFSEAVRVGDMLYLSGKLGTGASGLVPGGIKAETKQTMENIRSVLERNGSSLNEVVKCTVMLADMSEWGAMNEVYVTFFAKDRMPARSAFGVSGLALNARVEIECLATVR